MQTEIEINKTCQHCDIDTSVYELASTPLHGTPAFYKLRKTFSKYRRHYELISKYNVGLKTLLNEGLSEPEFYGDLVYKFKKLIGSNDFFFSLEQS